MSKRHLSTGSFLRRILRLYKRPIALFASPHWRLRKKSGENFVICEYLHVRCGRHQSKGFGTKQSINFSACHWRPSTQLERFKSDGKKKVTIRWKEEFKVFYLSRSSSMTEQGTSCFGKGTRANRELPSGEVDRRWEDANSRPSFPNATTLST